MLTGYVVQQGAADGDGLDLELRVLASGTGKSTVHLRNDLPILFGDGVSVVHVGYACSPDGDDDQGCTA